MRSGNLGFRGETDEGVVKYLLEEVVRTDKIDPLSVSTNVYWMPLGAGHCAGQGPLRRVRQASGETSALSSSSTVNAVLSEARTHSLETGGVCTSGREERDQRWQRRPWQVRGLEPLGPQGAAASPCQNPALLPSPSKLPDNECVNFLRPSGERVWPVSPCSVNAVKCDISSPPHTAPHVQWDT